MLTGHYFIRKVMAKDRKTFLKNKVIPSCFWQLGWLLLISFSYVNSVSATEMPVAKSKARQQADDIRHFIPDQQIQFLEANEEEFIALFKEQTTGLTKGTAIIVPDLAQPIYQQAAISGLYDKLNHYGWNSLLLTMPDELSDILAENKDGNDDTANDETSENANVAIGTMEPENDLTDNTESNTKADVNPNWDLKSYYVEPAYTQDGFDKITANIKQRLEAARNFAANYPGYFMVICQGKSCAWLMSLFHNNELFQPDVLIMLSAFMPQKDYNQAFAEQLAASDFPVLDLYQQHDNSWVLSNIPLRKSLARKLYKVGYRQRQLFSGFNYYGQQSRTLKEIYGFITASGM